MSASDPPSADPPPVDARTGADPVASGKSLDAAVVGRETELAALDRLLAGARSGRSGSLLLVGDPGIGKTTLLESARARAAGFVVLATQGIESEAVLAHAGLLQLVTPVGSRLDELPAPQAEALRAALGWETATSPTDRFLVSAATLSLLAAAATRSPVLVVVDDLQWLDRESAAAILFAARRMGPDAVAFLLAARPGSLPPELVGGVPHLPLTGLATEDASRLLPFHAPDAVVAQLVERTDGNPLALLQAAGQLDRAHLAGAARLPDPLPAGDRILDHYKRLVSGLSPQARRAVLLLSLEQGTEATTVCTVLEADGIDPAAVLDEASAGGVLAPDERGWSFRHPLLRSAVRALEPAARQREAHRALAAHLPDGSPARVWHLAAATVGTDDGLADELAQVARAERRRMGFATASAATERAAVLTRDGTVATQRLALAAEDAFLAGDVERTRALAGRVLEGPDLSPARGHALFTLGMLEQYAGSVPASLDRLTEASGLLEGLPLMRALNERALAAFRLNDFATIAECAGRLDELADRDDPEQRLLADFTVGMAQVLHGDPVAGGEKLAEVRGLALSEELRHEPRALLLLALTLAFAGDADDVAAVMTASSARVDEMRDRGAIGILVPILAIRASGRAWLDDHTGAYADAGEAADLGELLGFAADAAVAVEMLAWQRAARGLHDEAAVALGRARELLDRAGTTGAAAHHALVAAACARCRDDFAGIVEILEPRLAVDGGTGAVGEPLGVAPLLVEAYVALGRLDEAEALSERHAAASGPDAPARTRAMTGRCAGLTASGLPAAREAYEAALAAHEVAGDGFETARTRMLYGARLRREGQRAEARELLGSARDDFARMGLTLWVGLADHELAASGATARRRGVRTDQPLTAQETRVAILVAEGRSNKEVAAALFLSPKTVEHHLGSVFRKLGVRSRSELAGAFARQPLPDP